MPSEGALGRGSLATTSQDIQEHRSFPVTFRKTFPPGEPTWVAHRLRARPGLPSPFPAQDPEQVTSFLPASVSTSVKWAMMATVYILLISLGIVKFNQATLDKIKEIRTTVSECQTDRPSIPVDTY